MLIMIVSDSHAMDKNTLVNILKKQVVDFYIHCGDIFIPYTNLPISNLYIVKGNNDYNDLPIDKIVSIDSLLFFITHGHYYDVNFDIDTLLYKAKEVSANIVCFGHTHRPLVETRDSILFINPGSLLFPRGTYRKPTYCILNTETKEVIFYDAKTHERCHPFTTAKASFSFKSWFK